jgi:HlyD family secretion protein
LPKVEEIDRGRIAPGNDVRVRIDSLPELNMVARLNSISPLTEQSFEWPPARSFRAFAHIAQPDSRLRTGMNGGMDIVVNRIPATLSVPAKAVFTRHGKPVVYLKEKTGYRPVEVQVLARNPDEVAVSGVPENAMVALTEVDQKERKP